MRTFIASSFLALFAAVMLNAQDSPQHVRLGVGKQVTLTPGFPIGDTNGANNSVANYVVSRNRQQLTLMALKPGAASVALWDQRGTHRLDIAIDVFRELDPDTMRQLTAFVAKYPSVTMTTIRDRIVIAGEVDSEAELETVRRVAEVADAECSVTVRRTAPAPAPAATLPRKVTYELRLLEADIQFTTKAYDEGVEPSGRELYKTTLAAAHEATSQTFIGGPALVKKGTTAGGESLGIRVSLTPRIGSTRELDTDVVIETNLPIDSPVKTAGWRRFHQQMTAASAVPMAVTGSDLLAAMPPPVKTSKLKSAVRWVARVAWLPGVNDIPGASQVPVFANLIGSAAYRSGKSQLILVIVPRIEAATE